MITWIKNDSGEWTEKEDSNPATRRVHVLSLREGVWSHDLGAPFLRTDAEKIIRAAVQSKRTGITTQYRFLPAAETKPMDEETKGKLREYTRKKRADKNYKGGGEDN